MNNELQADALGQPFPITSVCREDIVMHLEHEGCATEEAKQVALSFTDVDMENLASRIADGCMESFWMVLCDAAQDKAEELKRKGRV